MIKNVFENLPFHLLNSVTPPLPTGVSRWISRILVGGLLSPFSAPSILRSREIVHLNLSAALCFNQVG
ncbi:hypothetical protein AAC387_Pa05g1634 [Persea americana]